jgi:hypothetical protein
MTQASAKEKHVNGAAPLIGLHHAAIPGRNEPCFMFAAHLAEHDNDATKSEQSRTLTCENSLKRPSEHKAKGRFLMQMLRDALPVLFSVPSVVASLHMWKIIDYCPCQTFFPSILQKRGALCTLHDLATST